MLTVYDKFFEDDKCDQIVKEILALEDKFQYRLDSLNYLGGNFFGCLALNDYNVDAGYALYKQQPEFSGFWYDYLLERMSDQVNPASYTRAFSKPGFQLTKTSTPQPGIWHYNSEKIIFPYRDEFPDYTGSLDYFDGVYTMTVMLTDGNFRFDYYPETNSNWANNIIADIANTPCDKHIHLEGDECPNPKCPLSNYTSIHYKKGTLVLQASRFMHRIGPSEFTGQPRITFQGHGVLKNNTLYLHW